MRHFNKTAFMGMMLLVAIVWFKFPNLSQQKKQVYQPKIAQVESLTSQNSKKTGHQIIAGKLQSKSAENHTQQLTGATLYAQNCAVCHGKDRQGNPPAIPSLVNVAKRLSQSEILNILKNGRNGMPSFTYLPENQRRAIADFLSGKNTKVTAKKLTETEKGMQLFKANCAKCHKAQPSDPQPPGQRNYGRRPPVLGGVNKALSFERFTRILNRGPFYMPSFSNLSTSDKQAIYKYLSSLPYSDRRLGRCGGGKCGMGDKCGGGKCR
jgi:mono/diheme cytochrome c family protein